MGQLFVFSAPSGAGKTTILKKLRQSVDGVGYSVSHTSRKPRMNEQDGVHYHFVDRDTFSRMAASGDFVEWAEVYGNLYGTSFKSLDEQTARGLDILLDVDPQGAKNIKRHYHDCVLIYILPPSLKALKKRLEGRGTDDEGAVETRFRQALDEIAHCKAYDFVIINDHLHAAVDQARSIILAERCRTPHQAKKVIALFGVM